MGQLSGFKYRDLIRKLRLPGLSLIVMPSHTHVQNAHTHIQDAHAHSAHVQWGTPNYDQNRRSETGSGNYSGTGASTNNVSSVAATNQNATATNQNTGSGAAHENRPPYYALAFIMKL